jgi:uncharacterized delta-60 repeat protein
VHGIALQSDDKIIVVGTAYTSPPHYDTVVIRYQSNGSLDSAFGSGGIIINSFGADNDHANAVTLQAGNKILVGGNAYEGTGTQHFLLIRFDMNGVLDETFGVAGIVRTPIESVAEAAALALQTDGRVLLAGAASEKFAVARYAIDGDLDGSFGSGGVTTTAFPTGAARARAMALQADGKILLAGYSAGAVGNNFAVVRYSAGGSLDNSFGTGGMVTTSIGSDAVAHAIAVMSSGKITVAGYALFGDYDFALTRYNP